MQYKIQFERRSEEEFIKDQGLVIDYDEIARKGKMSKEEALISKWYGVYQSRQQGNQMARIVVPGGRITSAQARKIAEVSEKYAGGLLSITTRQAIQLHFLQLGVLADMMRDIATEGLSTFHGCGDVVRNITACPLAETCIYRRINVLPHAVSTAKFLASCRDLDNLPRKLKITFSGCPAGCAQPYMNCIGIVAVTRDINGKRENGFKVIIGGGMGWKASVGRELFGFVPEEAIQDYCRAIALLYKDHGDRFNRATSRLKFVVERYGIEKCREIVLDNLKKEKKTTTGNVHTPVEDVGIHYPSRPLIEQDPTGTDGTATVRIIIPKGELKAAEFLRIAELSEIFGNQRIYTDNRQNLSLHKVDPDKVVRLKTELRQLGFTTEGSFGLTDMVSCVGTTYCPKAVTTTRTLFDLLVPVVNNEKYRGIRYKGFINITGCPNSCSPYRIADIGFRGTRIREKSGSVEGYEILVGGDERDHGKKLGDFKLNDCPTVVGKILDVFMAKSEPEETIRDFVSRTGVDHLKEACVPVTYLYEKAPIPVELSVPEGYGTQGTDFNSQKVSVPCQAGCPVITDVPGYIEKIAQGNFDEAYGINLEDNVMPGVLGRICVRPCQKECRHTWTDTNGTVEICHLKRSAADRTSGAIVPPQPWFTDTGYRVAVIGGGPAGLSAARELRRYGHSVTIYEKEKQLGGMLVDGVPRFRLPLDIIEKEIELITGTGMEVLNGVLVDQARMHEIMTTSDAVLLATGTVTPNTLDIEGLTPELFTTGLEFLKRYNHADIKDLKGDVVIIGGGFTAVDSARSCARTARKLLGHNGDVTVVYQRSEHYMSADLIELEEMERENIRVLSLLSPVSVKVHKGKLVSVRFQKNYLGHGNGGGKPEIIPIEGSSFEIKCNHLIMAIGQKQDWSILPKGVKFSEKFRTTDGKLFTAGDFLNGSLDVIHSIADGKEVAALISARVPGMVERVVVKDNQFVHQGDLLVELDESDYLIQVKMADAGVGMAQNESGGDALKAEGARAAVGIARTRLAQAERDLHRIADLYRMDVIAREQLDTQTTVKLTAELQLKEAEENYLKARAEAGLGSVQGKNAKILQKKALLDNARRQLAHTRVTAPFDGYITRKAVDPGANIQAGQPLMALVSLQDTWITANFKEGQMARIRSGQKVTFTIDAYPGRNFSGRVDSIMAGAGAAFSLLPPENATGNFVKVVQRIPVKIAIDQNSDPEHRPRVGMSVVATVIVEQ